MIISASYKTDIPAFYGPWFINRLEAGYCKMVNPYGGQIYEVPLTPNHVDGFVFWTRNLGPFERHLPEIKDRGYPFTVQYTVTGYPKILDAATIAPEKAVEHLGRLAQTFPSAGVWRYDPIVFTSLTPFDWHIENFGTLAGMLTGSVDEVVVSFAQIYQKTRRNLNKAEGLVWGDEGAETKQALLAALLPIAQRHGMRLSLCAQRELLIDGVADAACIDAERLSRVAGRLIGAKRKPHREACGCWQSRDIGDYDTCPHGCAYCYAVRSRELAKQRYQAHDPNSPFLFEPAKKVTRTYPT